MYVAIGTNLLQGMDLICRVINNKEYGSESTREQVFSTRLNKLDRLHSLSPI